MMKKVIFYSLFLFTLVASCNKATYIPPAYKLHQDANIVENEDLELAPTANAEVGRKEEHRQAARRLAEYYSHEVEASGVAPIPHEAMEPIIDRYIHFTFERGVNEPNILGEIPLMEAIKNTDASSMFMLLENLDRYIQLTFGRGINKPNTLGETPLMEAIKNPTTDVSSASSMFMLFEHPGIDLDRRAQDADGKTALHVAAQMGQSHIVKILLDRGANVNVRDIYGHTPLYKAVGAGDIEMVKLLLSEGARDDEENNWRVTALHKAKSYGRFDIVKILLQDAGAHR